MKRHVKNTFGEDSVNSALFQRNAITLNSPINCQFIFNVSIFYSLSSLGSFDLEKKQNSARIIQTNGSFAHHSFYGIVSYSQVSW